MRLAGSYDHADVADARGKGRLAARRDLPMSPSCLKRSADVDERRVAARPTAHQGAASVTDPPRSGEGFSTRCGAPPASASARGAAASWWARWGQLMIAARDTGLDRIPRRRPGRSRLPATVAGSTKKRVTFCGAGVAHVSAHRAPIQGFYAVLTSGTASASALTPCAMRSSSMGVSDG